MDRLDKIKQHLVAAEETANGRGAELQLSPTRSVSEWASDLYAMATKEVKMTERHGGDLVANVLKAHGVEFIFCLSGGHISPFLVSSKEQGIRVIDVRHEVNAVFAADAVGRLTGKPGVAAVTAGPGVTNTITAVKNCFMAQSPMVLLGGAAATIMQGRGALQDIDHMAIMSPITKWSYSCRTARDIVPTLRKAFQIAASGVPGPVFVELPLDVLYPITELLPQGGTHARLRAREAKANLQSLKRKSKEKANKFLKTIVVPEEATKNGMNAEQFLFSKADDSPVFVELQESEKASWGMQTAVKLLQKRLHAGAHESQSYDPLPITYPLPSGESLSKTIKYLLTAKRPLVLIGSQATALGPEGTADLAAAVNSIGIPCFLGGMARGMLGRNSLLHIRQDRGKALKKCDLVIMLGVVPDFRLDYGRGLPKHSPIITVNRNKKELTQNASMFWSPTLTVHADPCSYFVELSKQLDSGIVIQKNAWKTWAEDLKAGEIKKERENKQKSLEPALGRGSKEGEELVNPLDLLQKLEDTLPEDSILVADGGDFVATCSYIVRPRGPLRWLDPGAFGTLGVGGGFALGAKLVRPNSQVWIIWGDGSCGYSLLEFDTYTRHKTPVIALVGNDAAWTQIEREQVPMFRSDVACALDYIHYEKAAEGLGGVGFQITTPKDDIVTTFQMAQDQASKGKAVLINALIGKTNFREGSLSV